MTKTILFIIAMGIEVAAIIILKNGNWPTSGLMLLTVGIIILMVAAVLKFKKVRSSNQP